tara:strand:- start:1551 stop:1973 length:423 start_codon:yes stop_codon:yes gene_type:complete
MRILSFITFIATTAPLLSSHSEENKYRCKQDITIDTNKATTDNQPINMLVDSVNKKHHFNKVNFYHDETTGYKFVHAQNTHGAHRKIGKAPTGGNMLMGASKTYNSFIRDDSKLQNYILYKSELECGIEIQETNNLRKRK